MIKTKIMVSGLITSWQIEGGKVEAVTDFLFLGSEITMDGDCSHEIKRHLQDFPDEPVVKTLELPMQEAWVQSLVGELSPTCCN